MTAAAPLPSRRRNRRRFFEGLGAGAVPRLRPSCRLLKISDAAFRPRAAVRR